MVTDDMFSYCSKLQTIIGTIDLTGTESNGPVIMSSEIELYDKYDVGDIDDMFWDAIL